MYLASQGRSSGKGPTVLLSSAVAATALSLLSAGITQAQQAIGIPFVGANHLSFSLTELSRDGTSTDRTAVFGIMYGRRFGSDAGAIHYSIVTRAAARALANDEDGIVDAGIVLSATHRPRGLSGLSFTGAVGGGAMVWGQKVPNASEQDRGRVVATVPLTTGVAYDIRMGRATLSPFATLTGAYSREMNYVDGDRTTLHDGWRLQNSAGVSLKFREAVLSLSEVSRERALPNPNRVMFSAGISW